ncbi:MAG: hypothetical protein ACK5TH_18415 [Prosthecobacter sp.]|jgi:hypothetical protein
MPSPAVPRKRVLTTPAAMNVKYIRFPLWALAYGKNAGDRMRTLLRWAVIQTGRDGVAAYHRDGRSSRLDKLTEPDESCDFEDGEAWALGCEILGVNEKVVKVTECLRCHAELEKFIDAMNNQCGREKTSRCWVMLPTAWFWRAYNPACGCKVDDPLPWDRFTVLCAIKSKVGDGGWGDTGGMATVTWPEIQRRSLGYLTQADMVNCLPLRQDGAKPYSRDVIRNRSKRIRADEMLRSYTPRVPGPSTGKALPVAYGYGVSEMKLIEWAERRWWKRAGGVRGKLRAMQERQAALARQIRQEQRQSQAAHARPPAQANGNRPRNPTHDPADHPTDAPTHGPTVMVAGNGSPQWKLAIRAGAASRSSPAVFPDSLNPGDKRMGAGTGHRHSPSSLAPL